MKLFSQIFLILLISVSGFVGYHVMQRPTNIFPVPYILESTDLKGLEYAESADVLIIGDRMAANLEVAQKELSEKSSIGFANDLIYFNWGTENEGIHRTLLKLKSLNRIPELVIYHGTSEEFYEKKFYLDEKENLDKNLKKYDDTKTLSAIISYPPLSKVLYHYGEYFKLDPTPKRFLTELPVIKKQIQFEMGYKIFKGELASLIRLSRDKKFKLFFVTAPLNLNIPPKETCLNSITNTLVLEHGRLEKMIKDGKIKEAFSELNRLGQTVPGNAYNYFLLGLSLKKMGKFSEARAVLEQGTAFDCFSWRSNIIFNNIIRNTAIRENIPLIDFDELVNQKFAHKQLFKDEIFPLKELYLLLVDKLAPKIIQFFKS